MPTRNSGGGLYLQTVLGWSLGVSDKRLLPNSLRSEAGRPSPRCSPASYESCLREKHVLSDWARQLHKRCNFGYNFSCRPTGRLLGKSNVSNLLLATRLHIIYQ